MDKMNNDEIQYEWHVIARKAAAGESVLCRSNLHNLAERYPFFTTLELVSLRRDHIHVKMFAGTSISTLPADMEVSHICIKPTLMPLNPHLIRSLLVLHCSCSSTRNGKTVNLKLTLRLDTTWKTSSLKFVQTCLSMIPIQERMTNTAMRFTPLRAAI